MTPFFLSHGLRKGRYLSTDALCTVGTYITRAIIFRRNELLTGPLITIGLYIGVVMIGGAWLGRRLVDRMSEKTFPRILEGLLVFFGPPSPPLAERLTRARESGRREPPCPSRPASPPSSSRSSPPS